VQRASNVLNQRIKIEQSFNAEKVRPREHEKQAMFHEKCAKFYTEKARV
jgi:hypothetical protein